MATNQQQRIQVALQRAQALKAQGATIENNPEFAQLLKGINALQGQQQHQQYQQQQQQQHQQQQHQQQLHPPHVNGHFQPGPVPTLNGTTPSLASGPVPANPPYNLPPSPVTFTADQMNTLRAQIHAYKLLQRNLPIPPAIQRVIRDPTVHVPDLNKLLLSHEPAARAVDAAVKIHKATAGAPEPPLPHAAATPTPHSSQAATPGTTATVTANDLSTAALASTPAASASAPVDDVSVKIEDPAVEGKLEIIDDDDKSSPVYPYNAYLHPFTHLKRLVGETRTAYATRLQRLLIPSVMPHGLDPHQALTERNRYVDARIQQRIRELEALPSTLSDGGLEPPLSDEIEMASDKDKNKEGTSPLDGLAFAHPPSSAHGKLGALIELKSLQVLHKQRSLRAQIAERLVHGSLLPLNRVDFRRIRRPTLRDVHQTEQLERKQRVDRERRAKQKHVEQLDRICAHGREVVRVNREATERIRRLGRHVQQFHALAEKEEQKRIERLAKERLKALKADDEEAYMKLIDTAKDTRITHLLKQTDSFLDSLAQAVRAQQAEPGGGPLLLDDGVSEEMFGASRNTQLDEPSETDKGKIDYYAVAHRIKENVHQPSILVGGTLKDYQIKGLQWMVSLYNNKLNGILADEMGLGKTIQTISLVTYLIEIKRQRGPYLVIVPLSTMTNWSGEFAKWAPGVKVISYKGTPAVRKELQNEIRAGDFQVLLTTYEYIIKDRQILCRMRWVHMIIDEGHRLKNAQSKLAQTLTTYYHSRYRLILTGTPLQNNLPELWAQLNFVLPKIFNSVKSFDEWFNTPFANSGTADKIELTEEEALLIIRRLHKVLRPFLLRRLKKDVESELPDKVEKVVKVKMSALQSQLYKQMKKYKMIADGKDGRQGKQGGVKGLSNELMQLRKICQHPFLFESVEDKVNPAALVDQSLIRTSGKLELLSRILPKFFATGHRVLIFFQMTKVMDIMEDFLRMMGWKHLRLDGGTKTEERAGHVQLFNAKDSDILVFILSTRAGGLGLNLQTADTVIIFDSDWNPHADLQAQDRAHRIGQTKAVRILRFITEKSVEEAMYARARFKLDIDDKVIQAGRFDNKSTQEEQEEFLRSILEADQEEENEESGDMNDEEINEIIARNDEEIKIFGEMDARREQDIATSWKAAGNRGKPPPALISLEELPECYRTDEPFNIEDDIVEVEGRGARKRNIVNYTDNLDDDQWAMAIEEGEDIEALAEQTRQNRRRTDTSGAATPISETGGRGRGRKGKAKIDEFDLNLSVGPAKRKRGLKSMSVTPSLQGDEDDDTPRDNKRRKMGMMNKGPELTSAVKEKMKKAFNEVFKALVNCTAEDERKRCELFRELPNKKDYPDYYRIIQTPISLAQIRKRISSHAYKTVTQFRDDVQLMFNNARVYNQEGSWVYIDAVEMEKVFNVAYARAMTGSGLPGADPGPAGGGGALDEALTPVDDDADSRPVLSKKSSSRRVISDDEYLTQSDDE